MNIIPRKFAFPPIYSISILHRQSSEFKQHQKTDSTFVLSQNQLEIQNDRIVLVNDKILLV